jgi:hypothetical protein
MSKIAEQLFEGLRNAKDAVHAIAPGLKDLVPEVGAEAKRQVELGASELAAALFKGDPFVMYGPSQRLAKREQDQPAHDTQGQEHEQELSHER